jgi:hypothetical protein
MFCTWSRQPSGISQDDALLTTAVRNSETSVYFNKPTRRYIPETCYLAAVITWNLICSVPNCHAVKAIRSSAGKAEENPKETGIISRSLSSTLSRTERTMGSMILNINWCNTFWLALSGRFVQKTISSPFTTKYKGNYIQSMDQAM